MQHRKRGSVALDALLLPSRNIRFSLLRFIRNKRGIYKKTVVFIREKKAFQV